MALDDASPARPEAGIRAGGRCFTRSGTASRTAPFLPDPMAEP
jgi:hypothetical protein